MKLTCYLVVIGLTGLGLVARGAQPAGAGQTGNDSYHPTGNAFQPVPHQSGTSIGRGTPGQHGGPAAFNPVANATAPAVPGNDARNAGEWRRSHGTPTIVIVYNQIPNAGSDVAWVDYVNQEVQGYYQPGYEWGAVLKANTVDWAEFIPYLQQYIVSASPTGQDAFRRGFIAGFGGSAVATYDYALRQASQRS